MVNILIALLGAVHFPRYLIKILETESAMVPTRLVRIWVRVWFVPASGLGSYLVRAWFLLVRIWSCSVRDWFVSGWYSVVFEIIFGFVSGFVIDSSSD